MFIEFVNLLLFMSAKLGYAGIILLMAVESSFIPFPSEIVIPPAAYLASTGVLNIWLVVLCGIIGSLIGALFNYYLALTLGRTLVYKLVNHRFAKYLLLSENQLKKTEDYFLKYGNVSTFIGRLIPAVRQLISLPAGFAKMKLSNFILYTFLGSGLWNSILAVLGYTLGANKELLAEYYTKSSIIIGSVSILLLISILLISKYKSRKNKE
jgi:membrane protein DedA with SNARE-associated domain